MSYSASSVPIHNAPYVYQPISTGEIRLLELRYAPITTELEGTLSTHVLLHEQFSVSPTTRDRQGSDIVAPNIQIGTSYDALSYTWGLEEAKSFIWLTDERGSFKFFIRPNLESALKQFRSKVERSKSKFFWIDAICINQDDDIEKSSQIKMISYIYFHATSALVWLGRGTEETERGMKFIERIVNLQEFDDITQDVLTDEEWSAFMDLMRSPWFYRRWIVQEITTARQAFVHCGDRFVPWSDFADAVALFTSRHDNVRQLFRESSRFYNDPDYLGEVQALGAKTLVDLTTTIFRKAGDGSIVEHLLSLEELMSRLTQFEAQEPHDTVYAVMWLAYDIRLTSKQGHSPAFEMDEVAHSPNPGQNHKSVLDINLLTSKLKEAKSMTQSPMEMLEGDPFDKEIQNNQSRISQINDLVKEAEKVAGKLPQSSTTQAYREADGRVHSEKTISPRHKHPASQFGSSLQPGDRQHQQSYPLGRRKSVSESLQLEEVKEWKKDIDTFTVDYSKSVYEVYRRFVDLTIKRTKSLDIICRPWAKPARNTKPDKAPDDWQPEKPLPSWIPTIAGVTFMKGEDNTYTRVRADPLVGLPGPGARSYSACGKKKAYLGDYSEIKHRTLKVNGLNLAEIERVEDVARSGIIPPEWLELAKWRDRKKPPPDEFWRTICADRGDKNQPPPQYYSLACKFAFRRMTGNNGLDTKNLPTRGKFPSIAAEFLRRVQAIVWHRRMFVSNKVRGAEPLLGLAPDNAKEGDLICILNGCSVPVLLRKCTRVHKGPHPFKEHKHSNVALRLSIPDVATAPFPSAAVATATGPGAGTSTSPDPAAAPTKLADHPKVGAVAEALRQEQDSSATGRSATPEMPDTPMEQHENEYIFIGECYVHGMMQGEAFKFKHENNLEEEEFRLV